MALLNLDSSQPVILHLPYMTSKVLAASPFRLWLFTSTLHAAFAWQLIMDSCTRLLCTEYVARVPVEPYP